MAEQPLSWSELMALAVAKRDELNVFIKLLTNILQNRELINDGRDADLCDYQPYITGRHGAK